MRFRHFLVTGVEVLHLGGQHWESNSWPLEHWRANKGRFRLHTPAIDDQISTIMQCRTFGGAVEGIVIALEVADFSEWPAATFVKPNAAPSYKSSHKDLWFFAKLDWSEIKEMTLREQYGSYVKAVVHAVGNYALSKRKPKGFQVEQFSEALETALTQLKPSTLTLAATRGNA